MIGKNMRENETKSPLRNVDKQANVYGHALAGPPLQWSKSWPPSPSLRAAIVGGLGRTLPVSWRGGRARPIYMRQYILIIRRDSSLSLYIRFDLYFFDCRRDFLWEYLE